MVSKTSLRESARAHRWAELEEGLAARPDLVGARDEKGRNWLHLACGTRPANADDSVRTADVLLAAGLGIDAPAFTEGHWQATPLWYAIGWGKNLVLAEHLLKLDACPNYCLFAAAWNHDRAAIRLLLAHGADIEESSGGETPLLGAVAWSRFGPAEEMLIGGADPNVRDRKGRTPLHMMIGKGSKIEHMQMLVRLGARGDIPDAEGRTAIDILRRKRDPALRALADELAVTETEEAR